MTRLVFFLPLLYVSLHALTIDLKRGIENNAPFAVLHIQDKKPFTCRVFYGERGEPTLYQCDFDQMPESGLKPVKSEFFKIDFKTATGRFSLRVVPRKRSFIQLLPPPVHERPIMPAKRSERSRHWIVVGYEEMPPYLGRAEKHDEGLAFPLDLKSYAIPTIGAVDINGEPVFMKDNRDIETFMAIKEAFKAKKYKKAYDLASEALELYPHSIFASDFLRYRIKALVQENMKENADEIIKLGKIYIKRYASDEYLPEVLLLLARVYSATGFISDANYFFNRLIHEHKDTKYANLGLIYLGDQLYINGKVKEATKLYLDAYYNARDLDVASLAAYKLGVRYLDRGRTKEAVKYLSKIWEKNREFLLKDKEDAHSIARQLAARQAYELAIEIDKALLKKLKKLDEMYEEVLFEIAEWYDEKGDIKEAIAWYRRYLDEFAYGTYSDKAKKNLDELFIVSHDTNSSEALARYETLIKEYKDTPIADKALAAKMKLLVAEKKYDEALLLGEAVESIADPKAKEMAKEALKEAAWEAFRKAVEEKECKRAITMVEKYGVTPPEKYDVFLYECYVIYAEYQKALKIVERHLHDRPVDERAEWLCRAANVHVLRESYKKALDAAEELRTLVKRPLKKCPSLQWYEVKALHALGRYAEEMKLIREMAKRYGTDMRLAEIYRMGYEAAKREQDELQRVWLLKRLIDLQNSKKSHPYSPWAEFELMRLLKAQKAYKEALKIAESMRELDLKGERAARWRYETALLYRLVGDDRRAVENFKACAQMRRGGAWKKLCEEALTLENL